MMGGNTPNGHTAQRITNAILGVKMDNLSGDVQDIKQTLKDHCEAEVKWRDKLDDRVRNVEIKQGHIRNATGLNAVWAAVAAAAAGILSAKS